MFFKPVNHKQEVDSKMLQKMLSKAGYPSYSRWGRERGHNMACVYYVVREWLPREKPGYPQKQALDIMRDLNKTVGKQVFPISVPFSEDAQLDLFEEYQQTREAKKEAKKSEQVSEE